MHDLKHLQTRKSQAVARLTRLTAEMTVLKEELKKAHKEVESLNCEIKDLTANPVVSEHAMLRYFERVLGFDLDEIVDNILTPEIRERLKTQASGEFALDCGVKARVAGRVVVTLVDDKGSK